VIAKRFVVVTIMIGCVFLATGAASSFAEDQPSVTAPNSTLPPSSTVMKVIAETPYYQHGPTFDSYLPVDGKSRHPALILMHGGGWQGGDKLELAPFAVRAAQEQHWAAFAVNYRLSNTDKVAWPDEVHDAQAAIRYIVSHADTYDIDPNQVMILGASAGANLMALVSEVGTVNPISGKAVGTNQTLAVPIVGAALWSPPVNLAHLVALHGNPPEDCGLHTSCDFIWSTPVIVNYLGCLPAICPKKYADASPITWVSARTAPSYIANSTEELVPIAQVQEYATALQAAGVKVEFDILPGQRHAAEFGDEIWPQTVAFFSALLPQQADSELVDVPSRGDARGVGIALVIAAIIIGWSLFELRRRAHRAQRHA